jgi:light-independent protochlorophyllide reductase subunit B
LRERAPPPGTPRAARPAGRAPRANLLGPTSLGFRCRDDVVEISRLLARLGIEVNAVVPLGATIEDLRRLPEADFNINLYPEIAHSTAAWLERNFAMPVTRCIPMGVGATRDFIAEVAALAGVDAAPLLDAEQPARPGRDSSQSRQPWYSRSVDSTYLTGKRVFIFADATHALAAARIAAEEMAFTIVGLGTYSREFARALREAAAQYGVEALVTDDYLEVERAIAGSAAELVLGTQMERHIAKRLGIPCAVISAPIHVQDVPARYSPVYGFEGANVLFDSWVHPLMMGLEEHLLQMFRGDFEFHDQAAASHLNAAARALPAAADHELEELAVAGSAVAASPAAAASAPADDSPPPWSPDGEQELRKIPFFVRGKARRNTERFARERGVSLITVETLYEAKAHFGR